ncbi:MAG: fibrobacter succinogenes major paralogous domain-containing protein [Bacteroidetes bacterium]|nr:fibrobacter succinogenes major paralogous domain-containing protein [Bacteroidota bacterium]
MKTKIKTWIYSFAIMGVLLMIVSGCKKKDDNINPAPATGTVTDIDGNIYHTDTIGTQVWMVENLKSTKYNDGTAIPLVTDSTAWSNLITPGYCWYNNDAATYKTTYGVLYNWYAVNTGKLCPAGWHIPTDADWTILTHYLVDSVAGNKLKEKGTIHWASPNTGATNESGFTALPGGYRDGNAAFGNIGNIGNWWSSSEIDSGSGWYRLLGADLSFAIRGSSYKNTGFSVRCVRD